MSVSNIDAQQPVRHDIYVGIHKGLRAFMCNLLQQFGCLDSADEVAVVEALGALDDLLGLCRNHLRHEEDMVHGAMETRAPGSSQEAGRQHEEHLDCFGLLSAQADLVGSLPAAERGAALLRLYRLLAVFVGENFVHMHMEESEHNAVLWATHSDPELRALEGRIVASLAPREAALGLRWMVPAMTPVERLALLQPMRGHMPPEAFAALMLDLKEVLPRADWLRLGEELRIAA